MRQGDLKNVQLLYVTPLALGASRSIAHAILKAAITRRREIVE
jgi:hypothetical protein